MSKPARKKNVVTPEAENTENTEVQTENTETEENTEATVAQPETEENTETAETEAEAQAEEKPKRPARRKIVEDKGETESKPEPEPKPKRQPKPKAEPEKVEEKFEAPCGSIFDPDTEGSCVCVCKEESEELYNLCLENFNKTAVSVQKPKAAKPKREPKPKADKVAKEKDFLGDGIGTSASKINQMLAEGGVIVKEAAMELGTTPNRIASHIYSLRNKRGLNVFKDADGSWKLNQENDQPESTE